MSMFSGNELAAYVCMELLIIVGVVAVPLVGIGLGIGWLIWG